MKTHSMATVAQTFRVCTVGVSINLLDTVACVYGGMLNCGLGLCATGKQLCAGSVAPSPPYVAREMSFSTNSKKQRGLTLLHHGVDRLVVHNQYCEFFFLLPLETRCGGEGKVRHI